MARRRRHHNPSSLLPVVLVLGAAGAAVYFYSQAHPAPFSNFLTGQPSNNPNGTANPLAAPWKKDTGYSPSPY